MELNDSILKISADNNKTRIKNLNDKEVKVGYAKDLTAISDILMEYPPDTEVTIEEG